MYVLAHLTSEPLQLRQLAGLLAKNNVRKMCKSLKKEQRAFDFIHSAAVHALRDENKVVRDTASSIVTTCVEFDGIWPGLVESLFSLASASDSVHGLAGSMSALVKICEDCPELLDYEGSSTPVAEQPLSHLIPLWINLMSSADPATRASALTCLNAYVEAAPVAFVNEFPKFITGVFNLASDTDSSVQKEVCIALVSSIEASKSAYTSILTANMTSIVQFLLHMTAEGSEDVALEACEFWTVITRTVFVFEALEPHLGKVLETLLRRMIYSADEREELMDEDEDESVPDRAEDIKPHFHQGSSGNASDLNDDEEDGDDSGEVSNWNVKKSAAYGLDVISLAFRDDLLNILLPYIQTMLNDADWAVQEAAILALGCIAEGCSYGMSQHLPTLIPLLVSKLSADNASPVVVTACWTLSRYAQWLSGPGLGEFLPATLSTLIATLSSRNKKVQMAGVSAVSTLTEELRDRVITFAVPLLQAILQALPRYQTRNLLLLYDAVATVFEAGGDVLPTSYSKEVEMLLNTLVARYVSLTVTCADCVHLMECLAAVSLSLQIYISPWAENIYKKTVAMMNDTLALRHNPAAATMRTPPADFLFCGMDLVSAILSSTGRAMETLVTSSNLVQIVGACCMEGDSPDTRQSAFALVGDLARLLWPVLAPAMPTFVPLHLQHMDGKYNSVSNNAVWALGEVALKWGEGLTPWLEPILHRLIALMTDTSISRQLNANVSICLGRIAMVFPDAVASSAPSFMSAWCVALRFVNDPSEKRDAFQGLLQVCARNPSAPGNCLPNLFLAATSWEEGDISAELRQHLAEYLGYWKQNMEAANWSQLMQIMDDRSRRQLLVLFGIQ